VVGGKRLPRRSPAELPRVHRFESSDTSVLKVAALEVRAIHQQRPRNDRPERGDRQQGIVSRKATAEGVANVPRRST
jgi:hypothetical protein